LAILGVLPQFFDFFVEFEVRNFFAVDAPNDVAITLKQHVP